MNKNGKIKIGVYVCHCGTNISATVNVKALVDVTARLANVVVARDYKYMCSEPGQDMIRQDIKDMHLNRVVVSSCSPLLHEHTFRLVCQSAGLNPFLFQMANIREHCSWVTRNMEQATEKARRIVSAAVARVAYQEPLEVKSVPINPNVLIVGAGIAGIEAALRLSGAGRKVFLLDREPSIGGHMAHLDKTFPTLDCAACILTPKMSAVNREKNIQLMTYSEVDNVSGYIGNFNIKIHKKPRYVDIEKCKGCGLCWSSCPTTVVPAKRVIQKGEHVISEKA
jgi:heterodisulfide reductase subunit A